MNMKHLTIRFIIAALTFLFGVAAAALLFSYHREPKQASAENQKSVPCSPSPTPPIVIPEIDWAAENRSAVRDWSRKTGLPPMLIQKLRKLADLDDEPYGDYIDYLDARSLKSRNQVLVVTAGGNAHCLGVTVYEHIGNNFKEIWSVGEYPVGGGGLCRPGPGVSNPEAYVTPESNIEVRIEWADNPDFKHDETEFLTYAWNGKTYKLASQKSLSVR